MTVKPGTPPKVVAQQKALVNRLLNDEEGPAAGEIEAGPGGSEKALADTGAVRALRNIVRKKVVLDFSQDSGCGFRLEFGIVDISITDYSIAIAIDSEVSFEPKDQMRLDVIYNGRAYPALYVGGFFDFEELGIKGIGFVRDRKAECAENGKS